MQIHALILNFFIDVQDRFLSKKKQVFPSSITKCYKRVIEKSINFLTNLEKNTGKVSHLLQYLTY